MVKDDQENVGRQAAGRGLAFKVAALVLVVFSLSTTGLALRLLQAPQSADSSASNGTGARAPAQLFSNWPTKKDPVLVLLLTGQEHGYIQPCGCSKPQYGGLERRYNFVHKVLQARGWPVVAVDVGDIAQRNGPQALIKYKYSMEALKRLDYTAVGIGSNEMALPLLDALSQFALDNPKPRTLAANLLKKDDNFPTMLASWQVSNNKAGPKVGVIAAVDTSVAKEVRDPAVSFDTVKRVLPGMLKEVQAQKPELLVLLFQGSEDEAKACAKDFPQFHVILCLTEQEEPSNDAAVVGQTRIVGVGHKGRHVGLVGVYRTGKANPAFDLHYQRAAIGPEYETPEGKDADNPILGLLENYTKDVKRLNYLAQYSRTEHPLQREFPKATYVGSEKCKECHEHAYKVWKDSPHSRAYHTLETAKRPSLRQYDGECVVCHVTGFEHKSGFTDEVKTPLLENNGCENCHGPGSLHVKGNKTAKMLELMNPYKTQPGETAKEKTARENRLDTSCQKCHDEDNDNKWKLAKWQKIIHTTPESEK
ncbi:MAG TPA: multiheme c-type cytochrome [Gemmataceae bacterium]|jgi:hypothetical protein|nr:multiheme c-type cytochrome [Gemmataceae bacterium]